MKDEAAWSSSTAPSHASGMLVLVRFQQQPAHSQHACRLLDDSNALILPVKGDRPAAAGAADGGCETATAEVGPPAKQLSKSQLRKLRKIQEEKEKRERRADVMATLAAHQVGCRRCPPRSC